LKFAVVAVGGSAGSLGALQQLVCDLPEDLPAAVFVVTHITPDSVSAMPHILSRSGPLFATHAIDRAPVAPSRIFVAPPNHHLTLEGNIMRVVLTAKENGQRPSIDVLFRSAAASYGPLACGVLLSGTLDDGVEGLRAIRAAGGATLVQDPSDALFGDMPRNAIHANAVDCVIPAKQLAQTVADSVRRSLHEPDERESGKPSAFTCPDCGGTLWELENRDSLRFRCRTGHAYSANSMLSLQRDDLEGSLWISVRVLQERCDLLRRLSGRANERQDRHTAERFERQAQEVQDAAIKIRQTLENLVAQRQTSAS
jgi:two-component system, chemotaxis family, protein-glutamate methylesterase/glutaminase